MVGLVLLIACGNVAMLLMARNAARQREFGIRLALGGSKARLFQQLLVEGLTLVFAGALGGYAFSLVATRVLARWAEIEVSLTPDTTVLTLSFAMSLLIGLLFGLAPLRTALSGGASLAFKQTAATTYGDRSKSAGRRTLLALQIATGLVLVLSAGLLVRSLRNLQAQELGMRAEKILAFGVAAPTEEEEKQQVFFMTLIERLRRVPGVEAATTVNNRPGSGWVNMNEVTIDGQDPSTLRAVRSNMVRWNAVGPDYFATADVPLRYGRVLDNADSITSAKVAVVNETFVRQFFPRGDSMGHRIRFGAGGDYSIVGVMRNSKYRGIAEEDMPAVYAPLAQISGASVGSVLLRTTGDPMRLLPTVRKQLTELGPDLAPLQPMTLRAQFDQRIVGEHLMARLALFFGLLALLLVSTGLYGTLAYSVARRTPELGVRMALGAQRRRVLWTVMRENVRVCLAGILVGLPLSWWATNLLGSQLYGLKPHDPSITVGACLLLFAVAVAASALPAYKAASIDPSDALRYE